MQPVNATPSAFGEYVIYIYVYTVACERVQHTCTLYTLYGSFTNSESLQSPVHCAHYLIASAKEHKVHTATISLDVLESEVFLLSVFSFSSH